jgi:hypothetical protein
MPLGDHAYYDGQNLPRCQATPGATAKREDPALRRGSWECALPDGHAHLDNPRVHHHSWVQTSAA